MIESIQYSKMEVSAYQEPKKGQVCCGDSYFTAETDEYFICVLADGLGSGKEAKRSSARVTSIVEEYHGEDIDTLMRLSNEVLSSERGAVVSMFKVMFDSRELVFSGVGNVRLALYTPNNKALYPVAASGFLSGKRQSYRVQSFFFDENSSFILFSDGLSMNTSNRGAFSSSLSPREASYRAQRLAEEDPKMQDDVTFIFGRGITTMR